MTIPQIKVPGSQGYNSHRGIVSFTQRPAENAEVLVDNFSFIG